MRGDRPLNISHIVAHDSFTPHARGSTLERARVYWMAHVYPACAGIDPGCLFPKRTSGSLPRMRGDRPMSFTSVSLKPSFTPHARGSTLVPPESPGKAFVYPACAGIDRGSCLTYHACLSLPRMRGDRPTSCAVRTTWQQFTPHARGSTHCTIMQAIDEIVYPACAGIDLYHVRIGVVADSLPRMRGDRPDIFWFERDLIAFTPHARGSTRPTPRAETGNSVYPACAGIDRSCERAAPATQRLPRMRGDRPAYCSVSGGED